MCNNTENVVLVVVELMHKNFRFQSRHNIFYYIRSAAASFRVRRRYKMYRMSMLIVTHKIIQ